MIKCWIEAMRLRTLPVSLAGVVMAWGFCALHDKFNLIPAVLCLLFALLAQIASNFANEYYDFKSGLDRKGREGPRRGARRRGSQQHPPRRLRQGRRRRVQHPGRARQRREGTARRRGDPQRHRSGGDL